ncbi:hypothetical protein [Paenibacillus sp. Soil724D2]|uniref:hypothetical protein n=1 Tax=Paenibacillus sp. (strain Soil724D2) TaxID=1736392 RepID=UPI0007124E31|nr:hypothetical protein [Paenibacillus sp. Soil724D2]KRE33277.1 hypothetical protein ASG85_13430 [Paenibacillus sp. Soil724D2]
MKWERQVVFVQRDHTGTIIRLQEDKPDGWKSKEQLRLERAHRAASEVEQKITEYAKNKLAKKRKLMGGD